MSGRQLSYKNKKISHHR